MAVKLRIPTPLRRLAGGAAELSVEGTTVGEVLETLERQHPGFHERLYDERGEIRRFVNIYVAGEDIRFLKGLDTPLQEGEEVSIVPAVAGGAA
ncbi:MAG TPA: ubiquitin-like small modifier protein 1 [Chloroflexota bacterium]|jgi:molybdopterin synthase sulfur carrier subunit|nr:ubiquitin-like small modifier protein 1 [Chloroflexota bacterium]